MESVIKAAAIYFFLLIVFRAAGRWTLSEMTSFDFILLLIISEAVQQGMIDNDFSLTNAIIIVTTLVSIDILFAWVKTRWSRVDDIVSGVPMVVVDQGRPLKERMHKARIDENDIMESARDGQGLERMEQIKYAILEKNGKITVIPKNGSE